MLAKSVAKVNSRGEERKIEHVAGKGYKAVGNKKRKLRESEPEESLRKAPKVNDIVKVDDKPEVKSSSEDIIRSLVYNHLKKVSPKLADKF